jgi:hypothetical protein
MKGHTGREVVKGISGIKATDISGTYLSYSKDIEYKKESFLKRSNLVEVVDPETNQIYLVCRKDNNRELSFALENYWTALPNKEDTYVDKTTWLNLQSFITSLNKRQCSMLIVSSKWSLYFLVDDVSLKDTIGTKSNPKLLGGLHKYRASSIVASESLGLSHPMVIFPMINPINLLTMPSLAYLIGHDVKKAVWVYQKVISEGVEFFSAIKHDYIIGDTKDKVLSYFDELLNLPEGIVISIDIETFFFNIIDCIGFAYEGKRGMCLPLCTRTNANYWSYEDEEDIMLKLFEVLNSKQVQSSTVGQNFSYDAQFIYRFWGIKIQAYHDTMVLNHVLFNDMQKSLGILASIYCDEYLYWKGEVDQGDTERWVYNIKDVCWTRQVLANQLPVLAERGQKAIDFYHFQQREISPCLLEMTYRGLDIDIQLKQQYHDELQALMFKAESLFNEILSYSCTDVTINLRSSKQIHHFFTNLLGMPTSCKFSAGDMVEHLEKYPQYVPFFTLLLEFRSLKVYVTTFLGANLDDDGKMRTSYGVAGTKSYRLSSRKNSFGNGLNMANVPSKGKIDLNLVLSELIAEDSGEVVDG